MYYERSDAGYYRGEGGLHCEWGGRGATMLGLSGTPDYEHFKQLIHGLDPHTGKLLTAKLIEDRIPAWDVTASVPKGVTIALERGDSRIHDALWASVREAMAKLEEYATTRVRVGGKQEDRRTGNLAWYAVEHAETRPTIDTSLPEDHRWREMPDPDRHIHCVIPNVTFDEVEEKWKAVKFRPLMDLRKFFDRTFDSTLASKLGDLGYEVETKWKSDGLGGSKYFTWDIKGIPAEVVKGFSRRTAEVDATEAAIVAEAKEQSPDAPDNLSTVARDQLGATSRREKRDDVTLGECREYWDSRISPQDADTIAKTIARAMRGENARPERVAERAVDFSVRHHFEQNSAVPLEQLLTTAMEHSMGAASPADIERETQRQGIIVANIDGERLATTRELQREEEYLTGFAAAGRGSVKSVGVAEGLTRRLKGGKTLSDEQWDAACGLLRSENRVNLVEGPAGAGKSFLLKKFDEGMERAGQTVTYLATTNDAVGVLAKDGFEVNTVARFLVDDKMQKAAAGGRVVVDESSMLGHKDAVKLFEAAQRLNLKLILVGDPMQHGSVTRGALMRILKDYGGITPFRLTTIRRQEDPDYLKAATLLSEGNTVAGFDTLDRKGWVREMESGEDRVRHVAADYLQALGDRKNVIVVSPTHAEAARITAEIRSQLRAASKLGKEDHEFTRLVAAKVSEAERGLASTYRPGDVIQFQNNAKGGFVKGQRLTVTDPAAVPLEHADKFTLYRPEKIAVATGDILRFTGTVKTKDDEHTLRNGSTYAVAEITKGGDLRLANGWLVGKDAGHFRHGFVDTSFSSQGKTVHRTILAMSAASLGATNAEQLYVSSSRATERMTLYTDDKTAVRDAVQRSSRKAAALDLLAERPAPKANPRERARQNVARRARQAVIDRFRAAWNGPSTERPQPERPGPGGGNRQARTHSERVRDEQQERGMSYER
jgi:conjugative relaxase-like TrwC/TraI family protein